MDILDLLSCGIQIVVLAYLTGHSAMRAMRGRGKWLFQLLCGAFGCYLLCDMFWILHILSVGHWPDGISVADFCILGLYSFFIAACLACMNDWTEPERQQARRFRLWALVAPVVVVLFHIAYLNLYVIGYENALVDWLSNILFCGFMSVFGYYALLLLLTTAAAAQPKAERNGKQAGVLRHRRFYGSMLLFLLCELVLFLVSSFGWNIAYFVASILEMPALFFVWRAAEGEVAAA